jgi:hypothetical protein
MSIQMDLKTKRAFKELRNAVTQRDAWRMKILESNRRIRALAELAQPDVRKQVLLELELLTADPPLDALIRSALATDRVRGMALARIRSKVWGFTDANMRHFSNPSQAIKVTLERMMSTDEVDSYEKDERKFYRLRY